MTLQTNFYFLSPVEVVRVTPKNLEEVAEWCGGKVAETESRRQEGRMDKYVWVPTPKGSAISWAFPGMFITKRVVITEHNELKITYSVFRKAYFKANYFQTPEAAVDETWERQGREAGKKAHPTNGANPEQFRKMLKEQATVQITEMAAGVEVEADLTSPLTDTPVELPPSIIEGIPETVPNGQASMVEQRMSISEQYVEMAAGDPSRP